MNETLSDQGAIYLQIAHMIEDDILRGIYREEEQVPSTNELARALRINPATAAKGINLLVEQGEALRLDCGDGVDHFDGDTRPHYHFACRGCGCVMDLEMDPIDHIDQIAGAGFDGEIQGHRVLFYGLCPDCRK